MKNNLRQIWLLLQPSWLSGLVAAIGSVAAVVVTVFISNYQGSSLQQELFEAKTGSSTASALGFQTVTDNLARNSIVNNLPLFLFWAALGAIVYFFAVSIWSAFSQAEELREEMEYVNAPRQHLVRTAALNVVFRLIFLGLWLTYLQLFLKVLLPYVLAAAHVAATGLTLTNVGYGLLATAVLFVGLHIHVIFFRLVLLRLRAFGDDLIET